MWDGFGRLHSAGDGRGNTLTYGYDNADRITRVNYSDTTTYGYDDLGRLLTVGVLADRVGARRMFLAGLGVFVLASAGCALASSAPVLIAARGVQGLGAAALLPCSLALMCISSPSRPHVPGRWACGAVSAESDWPPGP